MTTRQIAMLQKKVGQQTAGALISTSPDEGYSIKRHIPYNHYLTIDLEVAPTRVRGKRLCVGKAWLMHEHRPGAAVSISQVTTDPYPLSTPMKDLIQLASTLIPRLHAQHHVLSCYASQMFNLIKTQSQAATLVTNIQADIAKLEETLSTEPRSTQK